MKKIIILSFLILSYIHLYSQIKVTKIEKIELPNTIRAFQMKFSPDGSLIYFTNIYYDGIWKYDIKNKKVDQITNDKFSGYDYAIDDSKIFYRRTIINGTNRYQEIVEKDLSTNQIKVIDSGEELTTPFLISGKILYTKNRTKLNIEPPQTKEIKILGIENTKIIILKDGKKEIFDPLSNGSYIWPSISLDGKLIVAYEMTKGTFICTPEGHIVSMLGRKNAPSFTRDGKWIVYMKDKDDGHNIITSDIYITSIDGSKNIQLTNDPDIIELNPICSPIENKILFSSLNGELYLLTYEETK